MSTLVGVISDTHGLIRPEVARRLAGVDLILHAGDVGDPTLMTQLNGLAPTLAVRGNVDTAPFFNRLPETLSHQVEDVWIYVLHDLWSLNIAPGAADIRVVVSGHTHMPKAEEHQGVLYLNPGSCGPRRFKTPVSMALLRIDGHDVAAEFVALES
jgi:hypothetical protein